jgi:hypothetical protein
VGGGGSPFDEPIGDAFSLFKIAMRKRIHVEKDLENNKAMFVTKVF